MRPHILMTVLFLTCSSFLFKKTAIRQPTGSSGLLSETITKKILDFSVRRFRGDKVFLSWHTEGDSEQLVYEVLRKHKKLSQFVSLGTVQPKFQTGNSADYSFIDNNNYSDSSYYCLKRTTADSVIFYSLTKGVEGVVKSY